MQSNRTEKKSQSCRFFSGFVGCRPQTPTPNYVGVFRIDPSRSPQSMSGIPQNYVGDPVFLLVLLGAAPKRRPQIMSEFYRLTPVAAPNLCWGYPKLCRRPMKKPRHRAAAFLYISVLSVSADKGGVYRIGHIGVVFPEIDVLFRGAAESEVVFL